MSQKIALVGHCGPDSYMLRSAVKYAVKDSEVLMITDDNVLTAELAQQSLSLLLVNRVLDGSFEIDGGIELIRRLHITYPDLPIMLVSNFADSQREAEAVGARPGFGKSEIGTAKMREALAAVTA